MAHIFGTINSTFDLDSIVISGVSSATLAGLTDVTVSGVTNGQFLGYDSDLAKWIAVNGGGSPSSSASDLYLFNNYI